MKAKFKASEAERTQREAEKKAMEKELQRKKEAEFRQKV